MFFDGRALHDRYRMADRRVQAEQRRPALGDLHREHASGNIAVVQCSRAKSGVNRIEHHQPHAERVALILLAVLLNRILIDDRLHLLDCHAVRVGERAFGLVHDQIALLSSFGHEASVLGSHACAGRDHRQSSPGTRSTSPPRRESARQACHDRGLAAAATMPGCGTPPRAYHRQILALISFGFSL
jgi:hypothetical protein